MILGIDPGRHKIGWAFVGEAGNLILSGILPKADVEDFLGVLRCPTGAWEEKFTAWTCERCSSFLPDSSVDYVAVGDGTGNGEMVPRFESIGLKAVLVGERGTTLAAGELYWSLHRPVWWQFFLPRFLRTPPRGLDDLAAWEIALRSLAPPS